MLPQARPAYPLASSFCPVGLHVLLIIIRGMFFSYGLCRYGIYSISLTDAPTTTFVTGVEILQDRRRILRLGTTWLGSLQTLSWRETVPVWPVCAG